MNIYENYAAIAEAPAITDFNHPLERNRRCIKTTKALFTEASKTLNVRCLLGAYGRITSMMSASRSYYNAFKPVMDNTVRAALKIPQFKSVLTEEDEKKSSTAQLGQLVAYAKKHMSEKQYQAIKERCPNQECRTFFAKLAAQIQENKDHATLTLADKLRWYDLPIPEDKVEDIRTWFNNSANSAEIQDVIELDLSHADLKVLPDELSLFTGILELNLGHNELTSIDVSRLTQLDDLRLKNNHLESIDVSRLTQLEMLDLSYNQIKSIDVSRLTQLDDLRLNDNCLISVEGLSNLTKLQILALSYNPLESIIDVSRLTQLKRLFLGNNLQANKDHATLALAFELKGKGLQAPLGNVEKVRAWLNDNSADIQSVTELNFLYSGLKAVPDELKLFTGLQRLVLGFTPFAPDA